MIFLLLTIMRVRVKIMLIVNNASGYKTAYDQGYSDAYTDALTEAYVLVKGDISDYIEQIKNNEFEDSPIEDSLETLLREIYDLGYESGDRDGFDRGYGKGYSDGWEHGDAGLDPNPPQDPYDPYYDETT